MDSEGIKSLLWFLVWGGFFYFMMRSGGCCGHSHGGHRGHGEHSHRGGGSAGKTRDPVCGMEGDPAEAAGSREYMGQTFYFCSANCMEKFDKNPASYAGTPQKVPSGTHNKPGGCH